MNTLPKEAIKKSSWAYVAKVAVVVVLVVGLVNGLVFYYIQTYSPNLLYHLVKTKWQLATTKQQPKKWLVFGDSSCNQGVDPEVIKKITGDDALNLCVVGDYLTIGSSWLLDAYIRDNGAPDNILLVFSHRIWDRREQPLSMVEQTPYRRVLKEDLGAMLHKGLGYRLKLEAAHYFPLALHTASIKEFLSDPSDPVKHLHKYTVQPTGYMKPLGGAKPEWLQEEFDILEAANAYRNGLAVSAANLRGLDAIRQLAEQHHINVYIASAPIYSKRYHHPPNTAYFAQVDSFLAATADANHWRYVKSADAVFTDAYMEDEVHLTQEGAQLYTRAIFTAITEEGQ